MSARLIASMALTFILLFGVLFAVLVGVGMYFSISAIIMIPIMVLLVIVQWAIGPRIVRWTTNLRDFEAGEFPWIRQHVEDLCRRYDVPMPKLALARMSGPNAFVFGRTNKSATLAVTQGLLDTLDQNEVKAVIGHEIGHIKHNDMVMMTIVSAIPIVTYYAAISILYSDTDRKDGFLIFAILAYVVYFITTLLVMGFSRLREYYSDDFGARATKPAHLASALAKITYGLAEKGGKNKSNAVRAFFIADPVSSASEVSRFSETYADKYLSKKEVQDAISWEKKSGAMKIMEILRSHPLTFKRIDALQKIEDEMGGSK